LRLASLANHSGVGLQAAAQPGPLFRVLGPGFEVTSEQFTVEKVGEEKLAAGPPCGWTCSARRSRLR